MWTLFHDMCSGGSHIEEASLIFIEASREVAEKVFFSKFGHNPNRVSCTCRGEDYAMTEFESLEKATSYHRDLRSVAPKIDSELSELSKEEKRAYYDATRTLEPHEEIPQGFCLTKYSSKTRGLILEQFLEKRGKDVRVIYKEEITEDDKATSVPEQGYVWKD